MFYLTTSSDTIAVFMPSSNIRFKIPIILSTGAGVERFINFEEAPINTKIGMSLNGKTYKYMIPKRLTGSITLLASSVALIPIRNILEHQQTNNVVINGTMFIINISTQLFDRYDDMSFTGTFTGANRNKTLDNVTVPFNCDSSVKEISLNGLINYGVAISRIL